MQRSSNTDVDLLLLYDGHCALCNGSVKWILKNDKRQRFKFAPLKGDTASTYLEQDASLRKVDSLILITEDEILTHSNAALEIAMRMGGFWKLLGILYIFPKPFRDWVYKGIARVRYKWFGKYDVCPMPPVEWRSRFLP